MFACIYIPDFPGGSHRARRALLREQAVAVLEGKPPVVRVIALNEKARLLGMEAGMTKLQAAVFAAPAEKGPAVLRPRSPEQENSAHSALLDVAHAFTPRVEDTAADTLLLDLAGLERLYGAPRKDGARAGIAGKRGRPGGEHRSGGKSRRSHACCARIQRSHRDSGRKRGATAGRAAVTGIAGCVRYLAGQDTSAAERECEKFREQMLDTLERWGVRDFRALALLPEHALASRLGEAGTRLQRLARGAGMRTLALCEPASRFEEAMELESSVETLEPLSFILNRLLEQLCARLETRALAAQELHLRLQLERRVADEETTTIQELNDNCHTVGQTTLERTLRLPVAMRDAKVFLKLLQLELAAHPPGAPVTKVWITAEPAPPRSAQRGLFLPISPEAERLEITLARISGVVGERRAGIARLLDSYRRDSFRMERFMAAPEESKPAMHPTLSDTGKQPLLALRIFRPAWRLQVRLSEGRPVKLATVAKQSDRAELQGKILWSAGPWRSSGDWWTKKAKGTGADNGHGPLEREEWDVALAKGKDNSVALYRIYRDLASGHWFADASYD